MKKYWKTLQRNYLRVSLWAVSTRDRYSPPGSLGSQAWFDPGSRGLNRLSLAMQEHCALHKSWQILSSTFQGPHRAGMLLGIICMSALVFPALGAPGLAPLSQTTRDLTSPPLPWGIWFHSAATGFRFLFLGRQGQLGMWLSSCLGFPLTSGSSGRIWGAWSPLMMLLSPRTESAMAGTGAERPWFHFAGKGERPARRAQKSQIWGKTTKWEETLKRWNTEFSGPESTLCDITVMKQQWNNSVEVTMTRGTVFKGRSFRRGENHCLKCTAPTVSPDLTHRRWFLQLCQPWSFRKARWPATRESGKGGAQVSLWQLSEPVQFSYQTKICSKWLFTLLKWT